MPEIKDASLFGEEMRAYWLSLQPAFRKPAAGTDWPPLTPLEHDEVEFAELRKSGTSGLVIILLMIVWWRLATKKTRERKEWVAFVDDVAWVLGEMMRTASAAKAQVGSKRPASTASTKAPSSKRLVSCQQSSTHYLYTHA